MKIKLKLFSHQDREQMDGRRIDSLPLSTSIKAFWQLLKPYWSCRDSIGSWVTMAVIIALTAASIYVATSINTWYKAFWDTIQQYDVDAFGQQILVFAGLATVHVLVSVYKSYLCSRLAINWRRWLTGKVMNGWLKDSTYYKLQLTDKITDNPDQRISDDLNLYVTSTISLFLGTATDLAMMVTFSIVLWELSAAVDFTLWNGYVLHLPDGYLFYLALIYAALGTTVTFLLGRPLVKLNFRQQRYEADFRYSLIRVRENAESIALYHGQDEENLTLRERFAAVVKNYILLINCQKRLGFLILGYAQTAVLFPILIAAPLYFAKIITMGSIMQINSAFGRVQDSLSTLVTNFTAWAALKAVVDRLALFYDGMDKTRELHCLEAQRQGEDFAVKDLCVCTNHDKVLAEDLNFDLKPGNSLLIRGRSGCGKSTLIRAVAGIWPYAKGEIALPQAGEVLFLSQRPYLPQGTLRQAAGYPHAAEHDGLTEKYFAKLGLSHLIAQLDKEDIWSQILSLGEQQRVAFVRALIIKPRVLFLDEASSALDEPTESLAYELLGQELAGSIIVSVGHRRTLVDKHQYALTCTGSSRWSFAPLH
ncbi:MAG: ABC transporter ATP-binding protein/permease [Proteobacteria bacterium]|uniref:ABC transporter ATP-binding protein/permease n=1 Tax=Candidatus Avisuccinivibrio stercorigallinarum TaxID=2840704 RepID=A0A9D9DDG0_9GAMM|nr:ABC transporter ATP-binding protein/permease [Candidatus Avisuccinivibrio stercorigallinarum]